MAILPSSPVAAVQPIVGGKAPEKAPVQRDNKLLVFNGVYANR